MNFNLRTLGAEEAKLVLSLSSRHASTVTVAEAADLLGGESRARGVLRRLHDRGWLQRASAGRYVLLPAEWGAEKVEDFDVYVLASATVASGYIGWWAAAGRHGFTTQVPSILHVATERQLAPREIQGTEVRYVKLTAKKFFGWQDMDSFGRTFRISNPEKTIVDCVDRPDLCGGLVELTRIVAAGTHSVSEDALVDCALRVGSVSTCQRLGYLLDLVAPSYLSKAERERMRGFIPPSARSIVGRDRAHEDDVGYVRDWGLLVHASQSDLLAEVPQSSRSPGP
ncbi:MULTISPECIES: type IV toxin-antitoxin system AbiEi family antitoxin domain-containing protein [unclassified Bradyrhizobium]